MIRINPKICYEITIYEKAIKDEDFEKYLVENLISLLSEEIKHELYIRYLKRKFRYKIDKTDCKKLIMNNMKNPEINFSYPLVILTDAEFNLLKGLKKWKKKLNKEKFYEKSSKK